MAARGAPSRRQGSRDGGAREAYALQPEAQLEWRGRDSQRPEWWGVVPVFFFFFSFLRARGAELLDTFQNVAGIAWAGEGARERGHAHRPPILGTELPLRASLHGLQTPRALLQGCCKRTPGAEVLGDCMIPVLSEVPRPGCPTTLHRGSWASQLKKVAVHHSRAGCVEEGQTTL